jgi:hypothetical protein
MAYILSKNFNVKSKNYGISAGSTIQAYLLLKEKIINDSILPKYVFYNYASMHNERNTMKWSWWKPIHDFLDRDWVNNLKANSLHLKKDSLVIETKYFKNYYRTFPLREKSSVVNLLENIYGKIKENKINSFDATQLLILKMNEICIKNNLTFVVSAISSDSMTKKMIELLRNQNIKTLDISTPFQSEYFLKNWDKHPNEKANKHYAESIFCFIEKMGK